MVQIHITRASRSTLNNTEHWLTYIQPVTDRTNLMKSRKWTDPCFLWNFEAPYKPFVFSDVWGKASFGCGKQGAIRIQNMALLTTANNGFVLAFIPGYTCIFFAFMSSSPQEHLVMTKFYYFGERQLELDDARQLIACTPIDSGEQRLNDRYRRSKISHVSFRLWSLFFFKEPSGARTFSV